MSKDKGEKKTKLKIPVQYYTARKKAVELWGDKWNEKVINWTGLIQALIDEKKLSIFEAANKLAADTTGDNVAVTILGTAVVMAEELNREIESGVKSITIEADGRVVVTITDTGKFSDYVDKQLQVSLSDKEAKVELNPLQIFEVKLKQLHHVCIDDELRPNLRLIKIRNGVASATNGAMLVLIDLKKNSPFTKDMLECLEGKFIHMEVWREMSKCDSLITDDAKIICNKNGVNKMFEYAEPQGELFSMETILEEIDMKGEEAKRTIAFNPELIGILGKIFQTLQINFSFTRGSNGAAVLFPPEEDSGMFAILMPVEAEKIERYMFIP